MLCPQCNGGESKEITFILTRNNLGLLYCCHRASCKIEGIIWDIRLEKPVKNIFIPKFVDAPLQNLTLEVYQGHLQKYDIEFKEWKWHGVKYAPTRNALYFPLYNCKQIKIGEQLKFLDKHHDPKVLNFKNKDEPFIHFPLDPVGRYDDLVLVEDYISALKLTNKIAPVVSLNGTSLSNEGIKLLKDIGVRNITLFMDGDVAGLLATHELYSRLNGIFNCHRLYCPMGYDPKNLTYSELEKLLNA